MADHLPECPAPSEYGGGEYHIYDERPCICDRLRACEQRVLLSKPNIELSAVYGYEAGRSDGLDAARDAVAALPHEDGCCSKGCACQTWEKPEPCDLSCNCSFWWMGHALAAIDALRGES